MIKLTVSKKVEIRRQSKKLQIKGAQILGNGAYLQYATMTKDAAQHRSWTFYEAVKVQKDKRSMIRIVQNRRLLRLTHLF
ncbi:MAG: hypothetical protein CL941_01235 [Desulfobacter sp.]|nr:hypothetical protein [Desulfobacter sp.]